MDDERDERRGLWRRPPTRGLLLVPCLLLAGAAAQAPPEGAVDLARTTLEKWVAVRRTIAKERRDWELGKELLGERLLLVQEEVSGLRAKIDEARGSIGEAEKKRNALAAESDRWRDGFDSLEGRIAELETRARALLARLPDPLNERVAALRQQIPDNPAATRLSLAQRFQSVIGILDAVNKFQRDVHLFSEVRELGDGSAAEVMTVYVGIGQGYYVTREGDAAGIGSATEDGWTWRPADEHAAAIRSVVSILDGEQAAAFVRLPVQID